MRVKRALITFTQSQALLLEHFFGHLEASMRLIFLWIDVPRLYQIEQLVTFVFLCLNVVTLWDNFILCNLVQLLFKSISCIAYFSGSCWARIVSMTLVDIVWVLFVIAIVRAVVHFFVVALINVTTLCSCLHQSSLLAFLSITSSQTLFALWWRLDRRWLFNLFHGFSWRDTWIVILWVNSDHQCGSETSSFVFIGNFRVLYGSLDPISLTWARLETHFFSSLDLNNRFLLTLLTLPRLGLATRLSWLLTRAFTLRRTCSARRFTFEFNFFIFDGSPDQNIILIILLTFLT